MPLHNSPEGTPSELPPPLRPPLQIVPNDESSPELDPSGEDQAKERDSVRGILEKGDDLAHYNPMWPPKRGQS